MIRESLPIISVGHFISEALNQVCVRETNFERDKGLNTSISLVAWAIALQASDREYFKTATVVLNRIRVSLLCFSLRFHSIP